MKPTLLVLAAGMGSRYGGLKQIDPMGPSGETILDYSVFDAIRAGFGKVVFIIRPDFEKDFRERIAAKFAGRIDGVAQAYADLPEIMEIVAFIRDGGRRPLCLPNAE
jgi:CTP:molybdopterin cytidylyltransferase MocA